MDSPSHRERKTSLRKRISDSIARLSEKEKTRFSAGIRKKLEDILDDCSKEKGRPIKVGIFAATKDEADLFPLMAKRDDIEWYFPKCTSAREMEFRLVISPENDLKPGFKGLLEPGEHLPAISPGELDIVVTPGMAFTAQGHRLGKGGGFYDTYFKRSPGSRRVGVCFPCQICEDIPMQEHDEKVHQIVTPD